MSTNRFWKWFKNQIAQEVPENCAPCAFDCNKTECSPEHWTTCARRLSGGVPVPERSASNLPDKVEHGAVSSAR